MRIVNPGFLRPDQTANVTAKQEARIRSVCPGVTVTQEPAGRVDHPLWGPIVAVRSGYSTDPALRSHASSGGALSGLLEHLLTTGTVDEVLETAPSLDRPTGNRTVINRDSKGIYLAAGSRYAPSAPLDGLERVLAGDRRIAFVGKPCDVAAIRAMGQFDPRISERIPVALSFFCAGVPSLAGASEILRKLELDETDVVGFRYRGDGWPGSAAATLADGRRAQMSYADSWGGILSKHVQFRCKICPDGTGGHADIVCADAWKTDERGYPSFEEGEGLSLIVSRTDVGEKIVRDALGAGRISAVPYPTSEITRMQPGQTKKRRLVLARLAALKITMRPTPRYRGFHLLFNASQAGIWANLRDFMGTLRRVVSGHLG